MRLLISQTVVLLLTDAAVAEDKKDVPVEPIQVVNLDRKDAVTFEKDVEPILSNKCSVCHSGNLKESKLDLGSYEGLIKGGKRGPARSNVEPLRRRRAG